MVQTTARDSCPAHCPGCPEKPDPAVAAMRPPDRTGLLEGWRLVVASIYVFVLPPAAIIAAVVALGGPLGEPVALAVGLASAVVLMLPAWRVLRRRPVTGHDEARPAGSAEARHE